MAYEHVQPRERACPQCGTSFKSIHARQRYCSVACRNTANVMPSMGRELGLSTATVGAIAELRVAVDLMAKGYHVFRALNPSCPCDLYAFKDRGEHLRVEVRTAYERPNGNGLYVSDRANGMGYNLLAAVLPDRIVYRPPLDGASVVLDVQESMPLPVVAPPAKPLTGG